MEREPAPDARGRDDRGVRDPLPHRVRLLPRRVPVARHVSCNARSPRPTPPATPGTGILGSDYDLDVVLHRGAGAYICGEETALLNSLEGFRGQPRLRPPFPAVEGLYESPTVINNVETLMQRPAHRQARRGLVPEPGAPRRRPARRCSRSRGKVERPGNYELPLGTPFRVLLEELRGRHARRRHAEGMDARRILDADAHRRAPRRRPRLRVDRGRRLAARDRRRAWCMDRDRLHRRGRAPRWCEFYAHESCGKCTPCREGTWWADAGARTDRGRLRPRARTCRCCPRWAGTSCSARSARWPTAPCRRSPRRCSTSRTSTRRTSELGRCPLSAERLEPAAVEVAPRERADGDAHDRRQGGDRARRAR